MDSRDGKIDEPTVGGQPASHLVHGVIHFLRIARLRKNVLYTSLAIAGLLGALYYASATRIYEAKATLLIRQNNKDTSPPSMASEGGQRDIMPTYQSLVKKSKVLQRAIARLEKKYRIDFHGVPQRKWVEVLKGNLSASVERRTNMLVVSYRSKDPEAAVAVVSAVIGAYVDYINETHRGAAGDLKQILSVKMDEYEQKLAAKETELAQALGSFDAPITSKDGSYQHPYQQGMQQAYETYRMAKEQRLNYQSTLAAVREAIRNGEDLQPYVLKIQEQVGSEILLASLGFNAQDARIQADVSRARAKDVAELQTISAGLGQNHPRVVEMRQRIRMADEFLASQRAQTKQRVDTLKKEQLGPMLLETLTQQHRQAVQQEALLRADFDQACEEAKQVSSGAFQIEKLRHQLDRLRNEHDAMIERIGSVDLSQKNGDIMAEITEDPVPNYAPVSPRLPIVGAACLFLALVCGGAAVYVLDILDDRFRSPEELQVHLGVPVLAMVRRMEIEDAAGLAGVQVHLAPDTAESEAFRTLRSALAFSAGESGRLVVSSSEPGDGKTTVLVNLAVSLAQSGKKTLLIDADLRRPGLTSLLGLKGLPGATDALRGDSAELVETATRVVLSTEIEGLDVLPSGPRLPNPAELLAGRNFADLLAWAESVYDQILIDSPPVLAASDSQLIGRLVDGVILVVNSEKNRRRTVIRAVESFTTAGVHVFGVVANRVSDDAGNGYGYGYGYGYTYDYGTTGDDEEDADWRTAPASSHEPQHETSHDASQSQQSVNLPPDSTRAPGGGIVPRRVA